MGDPVINLMQNLKAVSKSGRPKKDADGNLVLKLPSAYWFIGLVGFLLVGIILFFYWKDEKYNWHSLFIIPLILLCLGAVLILQGLIHKIIITDEKIISQNMFGFRKEIDWCDVVFVDFNSITLELKLDSGYEVIKCHMHLIGFPALIDVIEVKLKLTKENIGLKDY